MSEKKSAKEYIDELLKFDPKRLEKEAMENPIRHSKILGMLSSEKKRRDIAKRDLDSLYKKLYQKYRFHSQYTYEISEVNKMVNGNEEILRIRKRLDEANSRVEYLEGMHEVFKNRGFAINSAIKWKIFMAGQ